MTEEERPDITNGSSAGYGKANIFRMPSEHATWDFPRVIYCTIDTKSSRLDPCLFGEGLCVPELPCGPLCEHAIRSALGPFTRMTQDQAAMVLSHAEHGTATEEEAALAAKLLHQFKDGMRIGRTPEPAGKPVPSRGSVQPGDVVVFADSTPPRREWIVVEFDSRDGKSTVLIRRGSTIKYGVRRDRLMLASAQEEADEKA